MTVALEKKIAFWNINAIQLSSSLGHQKYIAKDNDLCKCPERPGWKRVDANLENKGPRLQDQPMKTEAKRSGVSRPAYEDCDQRSGVSRPAYEDCDQRSGVSRPAYEDWG